MEFKIVNMSDVDSDSPEAIKQMNYSEAAYRRGVTHGLEMAWLIMEAKKVGGDFRREGAEMQLQELVRRLKSKNPPFVVDVRTGIEFRRGHINGALHAPTWKVLLRLAPIPADRNAELVLTCEHGPRALIVKGLLGLFGYRNMVLLEGQMCGWRQSGLPMEK